MQTKNKINKNKIKQKGNLPIFFLKKNYGWSDRRSGRSAVVVRVADGEREEKYENEKMEGKNPK